MAKIGYIQTGEKNGNSQTFNIPTDESVGIMLFDTSGFVDPFENYPLLYNCFNNAKVQCIHNMDEASLLGIVDDGFMNGVLYYHLSQFYDFLERDQELYIAIADCYESWDF